MPDPFGSAASRALNEYINGPSFYNPFAQAPAKSQDRVSPYSLTAPAFNPAMNPAPAAETTATNTPQEKSAPQNTAAPATPGGTWQDYFTRAVIIILGFIFVGVGLSMFAPKIVPLPGIAK